METTSTHTTSALNSVEPTPSKRRNGKIAHLTKELRDLINNMLLDGATYPVIIDKLKEHNIDLNPENVSNWFQGGYQDWLKEREKHERFATELEHVQDLLSNAKTEELPDLLIKLAAARFFGYVKDLAPDELRATTDKDPANLVRLLNLVPKLSREALRTRKFRRSVEKEKAAELPTRDPNKPFGGQDDYRAVVKIVDKVLGLDRKLDDRMAPRTIPLPPPPQRNETAQRGN